MNPALRSRAAGLALAAALAAAGCAGTQVSHVWRDPALAQVPFRNILVVFQSEDAEQRRELEDQMARDIPRATPSYRLFPERPASVELARARVREAGYDSVVIMRVTDVDRDVAYAPGFAYEPALWRSWERDWTVVYRPGTVRTDTTVHIATLVYSVAADQLVWASRSDLLNPRSLAAALRDVVRANARAAADALRESRPGG